MVVWLVAFTTTCAISAYQHQSCEFEPRSWRGVLDAILCDKVCQWLATGRWFSLGVPVSSTNKTDLHDITEILLKVALNTINQTKPFSLIRIIIYTFCLTFVSPSLHTIWIPKKHLTDILIQTLVFFNCILCSIFCLFVYLIVWFLTGFYCTFERWYSPLINVF